MDQNTSTVSQPQLVYVHGDLWWKDNLKHHIFNWFCQPVKTPKLRTVTIQTYHIKFNIKKTTDV